MAEAKKELKRLQRLRDRVRSWRTEADLRAADSALAYAQTDVEKEMVSVWAPPACLPEQSIESETSCTACSRACINGLPSP